MGKSNVAIRQWLSQKERFASFVNGTLFHGKQIFTAENLKKEDGQQGVVVKTADGKEISVERYRDITMLAQDETRIMILACENQDEIHYAMPVRNMLYDALSYVDQISEIRRRRKAAKELQGNAEFLSGIKKTDLLCPVITIVFYYGEEKWDGKRDLHGLLGIKKSEYKLLRKFIPNYRINLIDPRELEDLSCFGEDLQMVFGLLQYRKEKTLLKNYMEEHREYFQDVDVETANAVKVMIGSGKFMKETVRNESGGVNMCQALEELYQDGVDEGIEQGIEQGIKQGIRGMIEGFKEIGVSREDTAAKIKEKFGLETESVEKYMEEYWK